MKNIIPKIIWINCLLIWFFGLLYMIEEIYFDLNIDSLIYKILYIPLQSLLIIMVTLLIFKLLMDLFTDCFKQNK